MATATTNEFNSTAVPSEALRRKLYDYALTGNEVVVSSFVVTGGRKAEAERQRKDREVQEFVRTVFASQERLAQFTAKLDRLDQASAQALLENEEKLRIAREELRRIRERAYELTRPDGSTVKVYRDGNVVRDDDGVEVDARLIKPEDIPDKFPTWQERRTAGEREADLIQRNREIREYRSQLERSRKLVEDGKITEEELTDLEKSLDAMPADVRRHYKPEAVRTDNGPARERTLDTDIRPTRDFMNAAPSIAWQQPELEPDIKPPRPGVSKPAPM